MDTGFRGIINFRERVEVSRVRFGKIEAKGTVDTSTRWTDKQPHPANMSRYETTLSDPEVNIAVNLLADMIAPSYYTEMPEGVDSDHKNKQIIDNYGERINLDEDLQTISRIMLGKGFCPTQRLADYDVHILPPEGFYIWKTKTGEIYRYTQEVSGIEVNRWETSNWRETLKKRKSYYKKEDYEAIVNEQIEPTGKFEDIITFINLEDPSHSYGKSLVDPIVDLVEDRNNTIKDINTCIHRYGTPRGIMWTKSGREAIQKEFIELEPDQWLFIGNVLKEEFGWDIIQPEMRQTWIPFVELTYYLIAEALHAPLLLYLKNATEASANVMMEAVDRYIQGRQRYLKRRVERYFFGPQCGKPVPRLVWGQPKTGLEEITLSDIAALYSAKGTNGKSAITFNQVQDLIKKLGLDIIEPELEEPQPKLPFQPFQKPPQEIPTERIIEKLNDMQTGLNVIETSFVEKRITVTEACRLADRTITVHMKRTYPNNWEEHRDKKFQEFVREHLMVVPSEGKRVFKVEVNQ